MGNTQKSLLEIAIELMEKKHGQQPISKIIEETLELKGVGEDDKTDLATQLYMDITTSAKFVFMGNDEWDLKSNQSLDEWDKDGSAYNEGIEDEDDSLIGIQNADGYEFSDEDDEDEDEDIRPNRLNEIDAEDDEDEDEDDEDEKDDTELEREDFIDDSYDTLDEDDSYDDDEDDYNDIMDKYEDLYDDDRR